MLQAAIGGYITPLGVNVFTDAPNVYVEPGFNLLSPFDFSFPDAKTIFVLLRIRTNDDGNAFEAGTAAVSRFSLTTTDAMTGEALPSQVRTNDVNSGWTEAGFDPYIISITNQLVLNDTATIVKAADVVLRDATTNGVITFRVKISNDYKEFGFLTVNNSDVQLRPSASTIGQQGIMQLSRHGSYTLISPDGAIQESQDNIVDFSYPRDHINYQKENSANDEEFDFSISAVEPSVIGDYVSIFPVPRYHKVGVLQVDGMLQTELVALKQSGWTDVRVEGRTSGSLGTLRFHMIPTMGGIIARSV